MTVNLNSISPDGKKVILDPVTGKPVVTATEQQAVAPDPVTTAQNVASVAPGIMPGGVTPTGIAAGAATGQQQYEGIRAIASGKAPTSLQSIALQPITGGFDLLAGKLGVLGHKTTKQTEAERWGGLTKIAPENKNWQENVQRLGVASHGPQADDEKWATIKDDAMKSAADMWGTQGMLQTFGADYFDKMSEAQRYAATQYAIDNGLLKSDHGDIIVSDPAKLKAALNEFSTNKNYLDSYSQWKKGGEKLVGSSPSKPDTQAMWVDGSNAEFAAQMAAANKEIRGVQAASSAQTRKQATLSKLMEMNSQQPDLQSNPYDFSKVKNPYL